MITKTYKLLFGQTFLSLIGEIGTKSIHVEFTGGKQTPFRPGRFMTSKPSVQRFIETHPWYNKRFVFENQIGMEELQGRSITHIKGSTPTTKDLLNSSLPPMDPNVIDEGEGPGEEPKRDLPLQGRSIDEVYSGRSAKDWIIANVEGVTSQELKNNEQIRAIADKFKLTFPNWK